MPARSIKEPSEKLWNLGFAYIVVVNIVNASAFGMVVPLVPGYVISLGATLSFAGVVTGLFSVTALLARPVAGVIGDRLNKKWLLAVAMFLNGLSIFLYALAPGIMWLLPLRLLHGLMFAISGTVCFSLGSDFVPKKRLSEGVGYLGIGQIIGMALGPNIGIYLLRYFPHKFCFMLCGATIMAAGLSLTALRYRNIAAKLPGNGSNGSNGSKWTFRFHDMIAAELLPNAFFAAILAVNYGLNNAYLIMLGNERNIAHIGLYFIVYATVLLVTRPSIGRMTDRRGAAYAIVPGFILTAVSMTLIGFSHTLPLILFAAVLAAVGGGAFPAIQADCMKRLDSNRRTAATGVYLIGMDIGMAMGQICGGRLTDVFNFKTAYNGAAFLMFTGLGLYLLFHRYEMRSGRALR